MGRHTSLPYLCPAVFSALAFFSCLAFSASSANHLIAVGSYDITGPAADVNLMGYANPAQNAAGIHLRLRARTFIVADPVDSRNRVAFVNLDACMASQAVTIKVLDRLKQRYGDLYTEKNVAISGTHTHSGPGGYLQYVLYIVTSMGFVRQSFDVIVDGIENSIIQAHDNLRPGSIFINQGELLDASINRSPSAYLNNPPEERARYKYDTDKEMTLIKFVDAEWGAVGAFNWFATHGTSMTRSNRLVSGDNKGTAARLMEDWYNRNKTFQREAQPLESSSSTANMLSSVVSTTDERTNSRKLGPSSTVGISSPKLASVMHRVRNRFLTTGKPSFVAAFCQSNVGDTSPNVQGAFCIDSGLPCEFNHSTCNGRNELCVARGPAYPDEFASTKIIGERQFKRAVSLFNSARTQLVGQIEFRHMHVDLSNLDVTLPSQEVVRTCPAALGFSFAAGTTDGPGAFNFKQGDNQGNAFWRVVGAALKPPSRAQIECQGSKPVLIDTGEMSQPYAWAPSILPIQMLRIGQLVILSVPAEFTTMAGRRLREIVKSTLIAKSNGEFGMDTHVVIAGLTNGYSQYVTTFEEYQIQRYEGASTLYGPHTLSAYMQEFTKLARALAEGKSVQGGPSPPNLLHKQLELLPPVVADATPYGNYFGDLIQDVPQNRSYTKGDIVQVIFWSACPRNDLFTEGTFALVEQLATNGSWDSVYDDDDLCLRFIWSRPSTYSSHSQAMIRWEIPETANPGTYRIRHFGAAKKLFGSLRHFTGTSRVFVVN